MSVYEVFDKITDSRDVTVGGGSASAISGAMAAGLIGMVARLSIKKDFGLPAEELLNIADECDILVNGLLEGARKDAEAYGLIVGAFAMPKATEEEKAARAASIGRAATEAAAIPRDNALKCKRVNQLGEKLLGRSNPSAESDLVYGVGLSKLAVSGCAANVRANLPLIKDLETKTEFEKFLLSIEKEGAKQ